MRSSALAFQWSTGGQRLAIQHNSGFSNNPGGLEIGASSPCSGPVSPKKTGVSLWLPFKPTQKTGTPIGERLAGAHLPALAVLGAQHAAEGAAAHGGDELVVLEDLEIRLASLSWVFQGLIPCPFFSTMVLFKNRLFPRLDGQGCPVRPV